jgi:hypothetical protein
MPGGRDLRTAPTEPEIRSPLRRAGQAPFKHGAYSLQPDEIADRRVTELIESLASRSKAERSSAFEELKAHIDSYERARDVLPLLPPDEGSTKELREARARCLEFMRKGLK